MKFPLRLAPLLLGTGAVLGTFAACGDNNSNTDDDPNGGAGGESPGVADCTRPGQSWCVNATSGLTCPEGISEAVEFTCDDGDVCDDGRCVGECEAGATECDGEDAQRVCTTDGTWATVACQDGQNCHDGSCGLVCVPGAKSCKDDGTSRTCKEDGSGWDEVECPGESTCSDGACRGSVCIVGAKKCADETLDVPRFFLENDAEIWYPNYITPEPRFDVIYTCTDGEQWEEEPCYAEQEERRLCAYEGLDRSVVAAYRAQVNLWFAEWRDAMESESELPEPPEAPEVSEFAQAECVVEACAWETAAIYSPGASRQCGDEYRAFNEFPAADAWKSVSKCEGFFPYAPTRFVTTECEGTTACVEDGGGCVDVECVPGEARCFSSTEYDYCMSDFTFYEGVSCPLVSNGSGGSGEAPGTCADTGVAPNRSATCEGAPVEEPILVMAQ